eukprot:1981398-Pyramimonas_sp.AAC.1
MAQRLRCLSSETADPSVTSREARGNFRPGATVAGSAQHVHRWGHELCTSLARNAPRTTQDK